MIMKTIRNHWLYQSALKGLTFGSMATVGLISTSLLAVTVAGTWNTFANGEIIDATRFNENFTALKTAVESIPNWYKNGTTAYYTDGSVGIGTSSATSKLAISGTSTVNGITLGSDQTYPVKLYHTSDGLQIYSNSTSSKLRFGSVEWIGDCGANCLQISDSFVNVGIAMTPSGTYKLEVNGSAAATSFTSTSSRAAKNRIRKLDGRDATDALMDLEAVRFYYNNDKKEEHLGFIAEDVPDLVAINDRKHLAAMDFTSLLVKVVQMQEERIAKLEKEIQNLQKNK